MVEMSFQKGDRSRRDVFSKFRKVIDGSEKDGFRWFRGARWFGWSVCTWLVGQGRAGSTVVGFSVANLIISPSGSFKP